MGKIKYLKSYKKKTKTKKTQEPRHFLLFFILFVDIYGDMKRNFNIHNTQVALLFHSIYIINSLGFFFLCVR